MGLAIDLCADYVNRMAVPLESDRGRIAHGRRQVIGDAGLFEHLPRALDAWVRFAGRTSKIPAGRSPPREKAISLWRERMVARSDDPAAGGPTKQFQIAAREAGIDLADGDA